MQTQSLVAIAVFALSAVSLAGNREPRERPDPVCKSDRTVREACEKKHGGRDTVVRDILRERCYQEKVQNCVESKGRSSEPREPKERRGKD